MRRTTLLLLAFSLLLTSASAAVARSGTEEVSTSFAASVGATEAWDRGLSGEGVGVALIDTGVMPGPQLSQTFSNQVSLTGPGRVTDGHGHGTFLAGLVVGDEGPAGPLGVAPGVDLWSVKVADADGRTDLPRVLAGLALVREHAEDLGIRVVVVALGGPYDETPDPLEIALEQLWASGLVVVVASGNDGELTEPGASPYLLTVGAYDDRGSDEGDPVAWSGSGLGRDGEAKPDVLAPGVSLLSARAPGTSADRLNPQARIQGRYFRGSGTSMSAAVTAGGAALLLEAEPHLTPDEVKGRLTSSSRPIDGSEAGTLDIGAALDSTAPAANAHLPAIEPIDPESSLPAPDWPHSPVAKSWLSDPWFAKSWLGEHWTGEAWEAKSWLDRGSEPAWDAKSWLDRRFEATGSRQLSDDAWVSRSWLSLDH